MLLVTNTAEAGTNGNAVTTGVGTTAWDAVSIGANTTLTYDNTVAAHGSLSYKFAASAGSAGGYLDWTSATLGSGLVLLYFRLYVYIVNLPAADTPILRALGSGSTRATLCITSTGALRWKNAAGSTIQTTTNVLTTSSWARIEGQLTGSNTAGRVETQLYKTLDSLTATEGQISAATQALGGTFDTLRFGNPDGVTCTYWLDDLGACNLGYIGPASLSYTSLVPPAQAMTMTARTNWSGLIPLTGQLYPRGRNR